MAQHNLIGQLGEEVACRYLAQLDYHLLHRNWRCGHLEVDIVADDYGEIVFVEVKTRTSEHIADALDAVTLEKRKNLLQAAKAYMAYFCIDRPYRFDVVTVVGQQPPFQITHIPNAFTPEGVAETQRTHKHHF